MNITILESLLDELDCCTYSPNLDLFAAQTALCAAFSTKNKEEREREISKYLSIVGSANYGLSDESIGSFYWFDTQRTYLESQTAYAELTSIGSMVDWEKLIKERGLTSDVPATPKTPATLVYAKVEPPVLTHYILTGNLTRNHLFGPTEAFGSGIICHEERQDHLGYVTLSFYLEQLPTLNYPVPDYVQFHKPDNALGWRIVPGKTQGFSYAAYVIYGTDGVISEICVG